jgi:hypothetical protein
VTGIGHNNGPSMEPGVTWRTHCWRAARERLLPTLPIEVVRLRVRRAKELGLDYKTYAGVRATTGHDVVAFLFSSNALRVSLHAPVMSAAHAEQICALVRCDAVGLAVQPMPASLLATANPVLMRAEAAPGHLAKFGESRERLRSILGRLPPDQVILVGEHTLERDWCTAGRLAAYLPAERYFAGLAQ